jgi:hypothetical protein
VPGYSPTNGLPEPEPGAGVIGPADAAPPTTVRPGAQPPTTVTQTQGGPSVPTSATATEAETAGQQGAAPTAKMRVSPRAASNARAAQQAQLQQIQQQIGELQTFGRPLTLQEMQDLNGMIQNGQLDKARLMLQFLKTMTRK